MRRKKLELVPDPLKPPVSGLSRDEEARALKLADIALHNPAAPEPVQATGTRAKMEHQKLMKELKNAANSSQQKRAA